MSDVIQLDQAQTINEIVARHPETIAVFNRFGMDTCCGGGVSIEEAARRDGLEVGQILSALREATEQG
ncbi:MAG TPA: DUF542 domain-containing protein [Gemmatimonadaceae bacterium]|nr:DUF542 domain-containing protein [Gemmatimonadaceae bacterium]